MNEFLKEAPASLAIASGHLEHASADLDRIREFLAKEKTENYRSSADGFARMLRQDALQVTEAAKILEVVAEALEQS